MPYTFRQKIIFINLRILLIYAICGAFICTILGGSVIGLYNIAISVIKISMFQKYFLSNNWRNFGNKLENTDFY